METGVADDIVPAVEGIGGERNRAPCRKACRVAEPGCEMAMLDEIKRVFDEEFVRWNIVLPEEDLKGRRRGSINKAGWTINYRFGAEGGVEYVEYFSTHRMTNDTLCRIYENGEKEVVGYCQEFYLADDPQAERDYSVHNQKFYDEVKSRGLLEP